MTTHITKILSSCAWLLSGLLTCVPVSASPDRINIIVDEYPPYVDSERKDHGLMAVIVTEAFAREGVSTQYEYINWARIEAYEIDKRDRISITFIRTTEREKRWLFSDVIINAATVFVTLKRHNFQWETIEDLRGYKIGLTRGYSYGQAFDDYIPQLNVEYATTDEANILKVLRGRIDVFPVDPYVGAALVRKRFSFSEASTFELATKPQVSVEPMYMVCSKQNPRCSYWLNRFNQGLNKMKQDGSLDRIIGQALELGQAPKESPVNPPKDIEKK